MASNTTGGRPLYSRVLSNGLNSTNNLPKELVENINNFVRHLPKKDIMIRLTINPSSSDSLSNIMKSLKIDKIRDILQYFFPFCSLIDFKTISKRAKCFITSIPDSYQNKLNLRSYTATIDGIEYVATVSKYNGHETKSFKAIPPTKFKLRIFGFLGNTTNLIPFIKQIGTTTFIIHETINEILTGVTLVGFSSLSSMDYLKLDQIVINNFSTIYFSWYHHPQLDMDLFKIPDTFSNLDYIDDTNEPSNESQNEQTNTTNLTQTTQNNETPVQQISNSNSDNNLNCPSPTTSSPEVNSLLETTPQATPQITPQTNPSNPHLSQSSNSNNLLSDLLDSAMEIENESNQLSFITENLNNLNPNNTLNTNNNNNDNNNNNNSSLINNNNISSKLVLNYRTKKSRSIINKDPKQKTMLTTQHPLQT
jgi:hypothetical protein